MNNFNVRLQGGPESINAGQCVIFMELLIGVRSFFERKPNIFGSFLI